LLKFLSSYLVDSFGDLEKEQSDSLLVFIANLSRDLCFLW